MNAKRRLLGVVAVPVSEIESAWLREVDLVGGDAELATNRAPGLHVDLWTIKRRLVRHFDKIDSGILEDTACHFLGFFPKLRFINKLLAQFRRIVSREAHQIFLDPEELEIFQIHLVY